MRQTFRSIGKAILYVVVFYAILVIVYFPLACINGWDNPYVLGLAISIASVATASFISDGLIR